MSCPARTYPFLKPPNHRVPVPRWKLHLPDTVERTYTTYIGIQQHDDTNAAAQAMGQMIKWIHEWLDRADGPEAQEAFAPLDIGAENEDSVVWVCYWSDPRKHKSSLENLFLPIFHAELSLAGQNCIGIWQESFTSKVCRLETNYSGLDYLPGLARLSQADTEEHTLSAYWGAARDRIPDSAHDLFPPDQKKKHSSQLPEGRGKHLVGINHANLVHIRSGQFWENCGQIEADAYTQKLEPTLRSGLEYLRSNAADTGSIGLRYLQNASIPLDPNAREQKESCGAGFFANLEDLERWAHKHQSHLKIYRGAMAHYKEFGDERRFRTWHEVSVIGEGDARFEYVNCEMRDGMGNGVIEWSSS